MKRFVKLGFIGTFGLLYRYMRGVDWGENVIIRFLSGKYSYAFYVGIALGLLYQDWVLGLITVAGIGWLVSRGWSFLVLHGDKLGEDDYPAIREGFWWSKLINWYHPTTYKQKRLYGLMHMSLRGGIYILPMAVAYGVYIGLLSLPLLLATGLMMGPAYYLVGYGYPKLTVKHAEMLYGLILMAMLVLAVEVV